MRPFERRAAGCTTYYKLAYWDERAQCWHDTNPQYETEGAANAQAERFGPGKYRLSIVQDGKRTDLAPFSIVEGPLF